MHRRFVPERFYNTFGPHEPACVIEDGDLVSTSTLCARGLDADGRERAPRGNPLTGPFGVTGAEPGDVLRVTIEHVRPNRTSGWTYTAVAPHVVEPAYVRRLPDAELADWRLDVIANTATLLSPETRITGIGIALDPMLGCIGVAPPQHQAISSATSGPYGGNMDYRRLVAGATLDLPVFEPGALLFLGDGHAVQGDGEIGGTGIEVSMDVRFSVRLVKGCRLQWPRGEDARYIFTIGNARPLEQALQIATTEMLGWLQSDYGLDAIGASMLLAQAGEYDLGNIFDPAYTMACKVAKATLNRFARKE